MPDGSEVQTAGAATLKPRESKVTRTRGIFVSNFSVNYSEVKVKVKVQGQNHCTESLPLVIVV